LNINALSDFNLTSTTIDLTGAVCVVGVTDLSSTLTVGGATTLATTLNVSGNTNLAGTLGVCSTLTLDSAATGDAATDCILVRDSNGVVKEVASCTIGITTAENGLSVDGDNFVLGGTLTGNTVIKTSDNKFTLSASSFNEFNFQETASYGTSCTYFDSGDYRTFQQAFAGTGVCASIVQAACNTSTNQYSLLDLQNSEAFLGHADASTDWQMICITDTAMVIGDAVNNKGLVYNGNYEGNFSPLSLVTCKYVDSVTSGITGAFTSANNGLCASGQIVSLGGALTGDTTISGAHTLCLSSITAFNATATNINLIGIVGVTGAMTTSTSLDVGGTLDVTNTLTLDSVADGDAQTDNVLVRDSGGVIKKVSASELGEDNNVYAMTVVTSNVTLTTGSTYVQLINNASSGLTITLPATPIDGQVFRIKDAAGAALTYPITIGRNGKLIDGGSTDGILNTDGGALELVYNNGLGSWFVFSFVN